ncbi:MAG: class I SAM-dependent methyltransferase, partial [Chloroflexia bacterium]
MAAVPLYDDLGADYDRFVDWEGRLALELPAIEKVLGRIGARSLLDAACGTGRHAIALARKGYRVVGADLSTAMLECARQNAREAGVGVSFIQAGLGKLARHLAGPFDAVLCLGHSLPHLLSAAEVEAALGASWG